MDPEIEFEWLGVKYDVSTDAYNTDRILLPDGTLLLVTKWGERIVPDVLEIEEVAYFRFGTLEDMARKHGAVIAKLH